MARMRPSVRAVLVFLICLAVVPIRGWGETYRSNEMGMIFESIPSVRTEEYPYYVRLMSEGETETKILFHEGEPIRRWVRKRTDAGRIEETVYGEGEIERTVVYDRQERPQEIRTYENGTLTEILEYRYDEGRITSALRYDGGGDLLERRIYRHDSAGRLREYREFTPGDAESDGGPASATASNSRYLYSYGGIREEWHGDESRGNVFRYNEFGNLILHEGWREGESVVRLTRTYSDSGEIVFSQEVNFEEGTKTLKSFEEGKVVREMTETTEGTRIEELTYSYSPGGNLIEKTRRARELRESWEYAYTDAKRTRTVYRKSGEIVKITEYQNEDDYTETVYRNGEPLVTIKYEDGKKVEEEQGR